MVFLMKNGLMVTQKMNFCILGDHLAQAFYVVGTIRDQIHITQLLNSIMSVGINGSTSLFFPIRDVWFFQHVASIMIGFFSNFTKSRIEFKLVVGRPSKVF